MKLPRRLAIFGIIVVAAIAPGASFYVVHLSQLNAAAPVEPSPADSLSTSTSQEPMQAVAQQPQSASSSSQYSLSSEPAVPTLASGQTSSAGVQPEPSPQTSSPSASNVPPPPAVGSFHWVPVSQMIDYTTADEVYKADYGGINRLIPGANPPMFFVGVSYGPDEGPNSPSAKETTYATDGKQIYWINDLKVSLRPILGADLLTFKPIFTDSESTMLARDNEHVYIDSALLPGADPTNFEIVTNNDGDFTGYVKDASHVWYRDYYSDDILLTGPRITVIPYADPATLTSLPSDRVVLAPDNGGEEPTLFAIDEYHVYDDGHAINGADPRTFELLCVSPGFVDGANECIPIYAKDATHVWNITEATSTPYYEKFEEMPEADPATFHFADPSVCADDEDQQSCHYDALDKSHTYSSGQIIN